MEGLPPAIIPSEAPPPRAEAGRTPRRDMDETMALPPSPPGAALRTPEPGVAIPPTPAPVEPTGPWTLPDFERLALEHNPSLAQAAAMVNVSRGRAWQAGKWPNPTIGYVGEVVGPGSTPLGEFQGFRVRQEVPVANKQRISRRKYEWEAQTARHHADAQALRVLNGVRIRHYEVLARQRILDLRRLLYRIADAGLRTTEELVNDGQANAPDLLAAQIQLRQARIDLVAAENDYRRAWVNLVTVVGVPELGTPARLDGTLEGDSPRLDFDAELARLLAESPHLHAAQAEVRRDEITVLRERVEPIPNLILQVDNGYSFTEQGYATNYFIGGIIPLWNRNKGTIFQAQSDMAQARANVQRIVLELQNRLADVYAQYSTALVTAQEYRDEILPRAQQATQLLEQGYRERRVAWPQVLVAQRNWVQLSIEYIHALFELRRREVEIKGLLMVDGLSVPEGPNELGHLNATPQPR
jgi:cobalt-zinc-cadmium efflux system outer membrane protein